MRIKILKFYAGCMTAFVTFAVYAFLMFRFTKMDVLEIVVTYGIFLYFPSVALPFLIAGDGSDDTV